MIPLIFFTVIPLFTAFTVSLLGKHVKRYSEISASIATFVLLLLSLSFIKPIAINKLITYKISGWSTPLGILLSADGLTLLMLITVNLIAFLVIIYSISYVRQYTDEWKFYSLYLFMLAGLNGVIISADIFNLYVFLEIASISGYILVAYGGQAEGLEAAFKYAIMGSLASLFILLGIGMLYSYVSTLNMADIAVALSIKPKGLLTGFISALFFAGFGLKAALIPFHAWLPDAHSSAPSPVSATLSGIVIKTIGVYALIRVFFNIIGITSNLLLVLMILGIVSMVAGAILALAQNDIKRMFAYSSISQIGYIIFAFGVGTPLALLGGLFHIFNHACFKSLLFLNQNDEIVVELTPEISDFVRYDTLDASSGVVAPVFSSRYANTKVMVRDGDF